MDHERVVISDPEFHDLVVASLATLEANQSTNYTTLARIERLLIGNGQPGLLGRLSVVETKVEERSAPSKTSMLGMTGALTVFLTVASEFVKNKMGG